MTFSSLLNFGRPAPFGRRSAGGFLALPYYSQHTVFASPLSAFFILFLYLRINGYFPSEPGLASFIGAKDDVGAEW